MTVISIVIGALGTIPKGFGKETGRIRNRRTSGDHPHYHNVKSGQNTEKSPGDLRSLVKDHQLILA